MTQQSLEEVRRQWDLAAVSFDEEPDHGLRDPAVRQAWAERIEQWLPPAPSTVLDMGCGTGSLSVLIATLGHKVTGTDLSPEMLERARTKAKAAGMETQTDFLPMDAAYPELPNKRFDAVICRHILWSLSEPAQVLRRWTNLLKPGGRLVLVEGYWHTGAGLRAAEVVTALPPYLTNTVVEELTSRVELWGKAVTDERYMIRADLPHETPGT